jgi:dTDP-4-dehydrorhamnose reductase
VIGASGRLGVALINYRLSQGDFLLDPEIVAHFGSADLSDAKKLKELMIRADSDVVINASGLTDVDQCQTYPRESFRANAGVSLACRDVYRTIRKSFYLVQFSTNQTYSGEGPHHENKLCNPRNAYAAAKHRGDIACLDIGGLVLRGAFIGKSESHRRPTFTDWVLHALIEGLPGTYSDCSFNPLDMRTLTEILANLIPLRHHGVVNYGSRDFTTKGHVVSHLAEALGVVDHASFLRPRTVSDGGAARETDLRLNTEIIENLIGQLPPTADEVMAAVTTSYGLSLV